MASILNRYENIMSTNVCGMIEFAEDPMKMARHLSHHMEDDLSKTKREGAELIAEIEKLEDNKSVPNAEALLVAKKAELMKLHVVGGGSCLVKNFGDYEKSRVIFNDDICATAKGYELLAERRMRKTGGIA